ncbi:hypothetical protein [Alloalcanivorax sp. C16-1]|uniref:hypothetical protein n=1 Tax=Alloalcanivorax sp. C16-1 TaxID=3390051 RepID=UPI003970A163
MALSSLIVVVSTGLQWRLAQWCQNEITPPSDDRAKFVWLNLGPGFSMRTAPFARLFGFAATGGAMNPPI